MKQTNNASRWAPAPTSSVCVCGRVVNNPALLAASVTPVTEAVENIHPDGSTLLPTLGNGRTRFFCGETELLVWRNALLHRYSAISDNGIGVEIDEYDADNANIYLVPELLITSKNLPPTPACPKQSSGCFTRGPSL